MILDPCGVPGSINTRISPVSSQSWRTTVILSFRDGISPSTYDSITRSCCLLDFLIF
nr:hypothetical protein Iba_chr05eCG10310 [Ipomoea batatas]